MASSRMNYSRNTPEEEQQTIETEEKQSKMSHSEHCEDTTNKQDVTYSKIKMCKSPWKHRAPTAKQNPVELSEEHVQYAELTCHRTPQPWPRKQAVRRKRQGPRSTVWRVVTCMLGALCVGLLTTTGILLPKYSCDVCSHDWIAFGNNFYHFFRGAKTWAESKSACEELNAHLLDIDSKEELENLLVFKINGWILHKMDGTTRFRCWDSDIKSQHTLINGSEKKNHGCIYLRENQFIPGNCSSKKPYTCEFNMTPIFPV